ncbi:MAG: hypothetical protein EPO35_11855 [Acidobacteria bacterium]|nr:MAG: hypothetical protein EPO35_11855 [Acidobacteriota bacterium]
MRSRAFPVLTAVAVLLLFYGVPTAIEAGFISAPRALIIFGDLIGCVAIARISWKLGASLYAGLTGIEAVLVQTALVGPSTLLWITDLVPALVLAAFAVALVTVSDLN